MEDAGANAKHATKQLHMLTLQWLARMGNRTRRRCPGHGSSEPALGQLNREPEQVGQQTVSVLRVQQAAQQSGSQLTGIYR